MTSFEEVDELRRLLHEALDRIKFLEMELFLRTGEKNGLQEKLDEARIELGKYRKG